MITNAANTIAAEPAARPSIPSVRFTAFEKPYDRQSTATTNQRLDAMLRSSVRVNDRCVETFTHSSASSAKPTATSSWPPVLPRLRSPRLRPRRTPR